MKSLLPMEVASILVIGLEDIPDSVYDGSFVVMHSAGHIQFPRVPESAMTLKRASEYASCV